MNSIEKLRLMAKNTGNIICTKTALEHGVSRATLSKLCSDGMLQRISHGQYTFVDDMSDELLSISMRSDLLVFSHETSLFLHGISDRTPFVHSVTAPSDRVPSQAIKKECKVYYIKPELFFLGKTELTTPAGNKILGYDLERTVCDIIRSRNKMSNETFLFALKSYSAKPQKNLIKLANYAEQMKIYGTVRKYMEVLL